MNRDPVKGIGSIRRPMDIVEAIMDRVLPVV
jgi:hypothetical protein